MAIDAKLKVATRVPSGLLAEVGGVPSPIQTRAQSLDERILGWRYQCASIKESAAELDPEPKKIVTRCVGKVSDLVDGLVLGARQALIGMARAEAGRRSATAAGIRLAEATRPVSPQERKHIELEVNEQLLVESAARALEWDRTTTAVNGERSLDPTSVRSQATKLANAAADALKQGKARLEDIRLEALRPRSLKVDQKMNVVEYLGGTETLQYLKSLGTVKAVQYLASEIQNCVVKVDDKWILTDVGKTMIARLDPPARAYLSGVMESSKFVLSGKIDERAAGGGTHGGELDATINEARRLLRALDLIVQDNIPESLARAGALLDVLVSLYRDIASKGSLSHYSPMDFSATFGNSASGQQRVMNELQWEPDESFPVRWLLGPEGRSRLLKRPLGKGNP